MFTPKKALYSVVGVPTMPALYMETRHNEARYNEGAL